MIQKKIYHNKINLFEDDRPDAVDGGRRHRQVLSLCVEVCRVCVYVCMCYTCVCVVCVCVWFVVRVFACRVCVLCSVFCVRFGFCVLCVVCVWGVLCGACTWCADGVSASVSVSVRE